MRTPRRFAGATVACQRLLPAIISGSSQRELRRAVEHGHRHALRDVERRDFEAAEVRRQNDDALAARARRFDNVPAARMRPTSRATFSSLPNQTAISSVTPLPASATAARSSAPHCASPPHTPLA